jgi:hypothetical protein
MKVRILKETYDKLMEGVEKKYAYFIAPAEDIGKIQHQGLLPERADWDEEKDNVKGVHMLKSTQDVAKVLETWLGANIEYWEDTNERAYNEMMLTIDITGLELIEGIGNVLISTEPIDSKRIIKATSVH